MPIGNTGVFWAIEDCPIPEGVDPYKISGKIKSVLAKKGKCGGKVTIRAYGGETTTLETIPPRGDSLSYVGWRIDTQVSGSIVDRMQRDILFWAYENRFGPDAKDCEIPNLVVFAQNVSLDSDFGRTLRYLSFWDYKVIVALPNEAECVYASSVWLWPSLFD